MPEGLRVHGRILVMPTRASSNRSWLAAPLSIAALAACSSTALPPPLVRAVEPATAFEASPAEVAILGEGFFLTAHRRLGWDTSVDATFRAQVGGVALEDVRWVSSDELTARIPGTLPLGSHALTIETPNGSADLTDAFAVIPSGTSIEQCASRVDDDGDGLIDCADPDCAARACDDGSACTTGDTCAADGSCLGTSTCVPSEGPWPYAPSNFDPRALTPGAAGSISKCDALFSTSSDSFIASCGLAPTVTRVALSDGRQATLLAFRDLTIGAGASFSLIGDTPAILAVYGTATIEGRLLANSTASQQGAGSTVYPAGGAACLGRSGEDGATSGVGGGGAGHRTAGGSGGSLSATAGGPGGTSDPAPAPVPLRGGCPGGAPSYVLVGAAGSGGGALQLSASGEVNATGVLSVSGGGGNGGSGNNEGGGGGGSGGTLVIEADWITLRATSKLTANGGGGGGGAGASSATGGAGGDGAVTTAQPAPGGTAGTGSGVGGAGGAGSATPLAGAGVTNYGAGGGGGSAGSIFIRSTAGQCKVDGLVSPPSQLTNCP
jgi:hypothetical protein